MRFIYFCNLELRIVGLWVFSRVLGRGGFVFIRRESISVKVVSFVLSFVGSFGFGEL